MSDDDSLAVAEFIRTKGITRCPTAFGLPTQALLGVAMATGMAPSTIGRGLKELAQDEPSERVRRPGAGRKPAIVKSGTSRPSG